MMVKPMKTLELHHPVIQFLIKADKPRRMLVEHEKNSSSFLPASQVKRNGPY